MSGHGTHNRANRKSGGPRRARFDIPLSRGDMKQVLLLLQARKEVGNDLVDKFLKDFPDVVIDEDTLEFLREAKRTLDK